MIYLGYVIKGFIKHNKHKIANLKIQTKNILIRHYFINLLWGFQLDDVGFIFEIKLSLEEITITQQT